MNTILGDDLATEDSAAEATEVLATAARGPGGAGVGESDKSLNFSFGIDGVFGALKSQLISKGNFGVFKSTNKSTKNLE